MMDPRLKMQCVLGLRATSCIGALTDVFPMMADSTNEAETYQTFWCRKVTARSCILKSLKLWARFGKDERMQCSIRHLESRSWSRNLENLEVSSEHKCRAGGRGAAHLFQKYFR